jgi:hypothetical protein
VSGLEPETYPMGVGGMHEFFKKIYLADKVRSTVRIIQERIEFL